MVAQRVCSLEMSKSLFDTGVMVPAVEYWDGSGNETIQNPPLWEGGYYPAYSAGELFDMLPTGKIRTREPNVVYGVEVYKNCIHQYMARYTSRYTAAWIGYCAETLEDALAGLLLRLMATIGSKVTSDGINEGTLWE